MRSELLEKSWPSILRWILIVAIYPPFLVALQHVVHTEDNYVIGMCFSRDGQQLVVFRGTRNRRSWMVDESSCEVRVWDIATSRLVHTFSTGHGLVEPTLDGMHYVDYGRDRRIRLLNQSFQPVKTWNLAADVGEICRVTVTDQLLIVNSDARDGDETLVSCHDRRDGHVVKKWSGHGVEEMTSRDGRRMFVTIPDHVNHLTKSYVFNIDGAIVTESIGPPIDGRVIAADSTGNLVVLDSGARQTFFSIHNHRNGNYTDWEPVTGLRYPVSLVLTDDGRMRVICEEDYMLSTYDSTTCKQITSYRLPGLSTWMNYFAISPEQRYIAGSVDANQVHVWDMDTGRRVARLPDHRLLHWTLGITYVLWCLAWVGTGTRLKQPRPWIDLMLINFFPVSILILYTSLDVYPWSQVPYSYLDAPLAIPLGLAHLAALAGMLSVWSVYGRSRWSLRLAGSVGGLGALAAIPQISPYRADETVWSVLLGAFGFVGVIVSLLSLWRWRGFEIRSDTLTTTINLEPRNLRWQIPLLDVLLLTAAIAVSVFALRLVVPRAPPILVVTYVTMHGSILAAVVFVSACAALSSQHFLLRLSLTGIAALVAGLLPPMTASDNRVEILWWSEFLFVAAAVITFFSLSVFRLHGYRLRRRDGTVVEKKECHWPEPV